MRRFTNRLVKSIFLLAAVMMLSLTAAYAQNVKVSGTVTDANGDPVISAAVFEKGNTKNGTVTDTDGNFSISVPSKGTLLFSCLGYSDLEVAVAGKAIINVVLEMSAEALDDVVVTAQGLTRKQKAIGYSAQKIGGEDLTISRIGDISNSLAGKVAGAMFWGKSGATFDSGSIILRGTTSYSDAKGSQPLYVVDGAITSADAINMDDIESINVLKGPSATALYGSRGGNGAVIVTTRKGDSSGRGRVEFSHTTTANVFRKQVQFNNLYGGGSMGAYTDTYGSKYGAGKYDYTSAEFLFGTIGEMEVDGGYYMDYYSDENWGPRYDPNVKVASALYWDPTSSKYHQLDPWVSQLDMRDLTQVGWNHTTNIAFSKSGQDYSTRVSFTNTAMNGVMLNSDAARRFLSISTQFTPKKWISLSLNYKYTYRKNHNAAREGYSAVGNVICDFTQWGHTNVNIADYKDYVRPDGTYRTWNITDIDDFSAMFHDNPYATMDQLNAYSYNHYHVYGGDVHFNLPYNIKVGYRLNGYARNINSINKYNCEYLTATLSSYSQSQQQIMDITNQFYASYAGSYVDNRLTLEADLFAEFRGYDSQYLYSTTNQGLNYPEYFNLAGSLGTYSTSNEESHYKTRSFFGTATLGFDDTIFLDLSLRNDIDSRLANGNNSYLYGGGSLSLMLSKFINAKWLDFWKLRGSIAQVGSTLGAYKIYNTYTIGTKNGSLNTMYEPTTQKNQNIKPSISTSFEVGTEFKLFKNRLYGDLNFYLKNTKNQIISANVLPQSGYSYRTLNAGLVTNKGVEFLIGGSPVKNKNVQLDINFNLAKNVNTLVKLTDDQKEYTISWNKFYYQFGLRAIEGQPIGVLYSGARWAVDEKTGKPIYKKSTSASWGEIRPVFDYSEKNVGNVQPDLTGGFSLNLRLYRFSLAASLDYMVGGKFFSWTNMWGTGSGTLASTATVNNRGKNVREAIVDGGGVYAEGVDEEGNPISGYMSAYNYYHYQAYYNNDAWMFDRTYVKLREVSLGYQFPTKWFKAIGISNFGLSLVATNPWLIYSKCPNVDPSEIGGASYGYLEGGQAISTRSFGATINISF